MPPFRRLAVATACASAAATALAQTAPAPAASAASAPTRQDTLAPVTITGQREGGYTVPETAAATKLTLSPRETPQSITVVTRERLDDQHLTNLRSVLDQTPGLYSNAYDSERVIFYSRGFLVDSLLIDGVPALTNFSTGSVDETIETAFYDRIEIVRGASGLMTGAGTPGASINLLRKHADARSLTATADLSLGSWRDRRAVIDLSTPLASDGSIRGRVVALGQDAHSYQDLYHKKKSGLYAIVDADLGSSTRLSFGYDYQYNQPKANTWGSFPLYLGDGSWADWPRSVTTATDWAYWNRRTQTVFAELRQNLGGGWTLQANANWRRYDEDLELFYVYGYPDPVDGSGLFPYAYKSRAKTYERAIDAYASGPFSLLGRQHEAVVGVSGSRSHNVGDEFQHGALADTGNFFEWDGSYPRPDFATTPTRLQDVTTTQYGLYGALRLSLTDKLKAIGGARYADWKADSFYIYNSPANSSAGAHKVIPYAGLVWDVLPSYSLFASYTGIFKPQADRDLDGNYLPPIQGRSYEVGIKGEHFDKRLNTSFVLFETEQTNLATPLLDSAGLPITRPDGSTVMQASDRLRSRGFELEVSGKLATGLQGSLGWTRALIRDKDKQPARTFIPETIVRSFVTWQPSAFVEGLTLGGGVDFQSHSSTTVGTPTGSATQRQGSFVLVSLMGRYAFSKNASLQVNANNVLDKKYYVLDQYGNSYYGAPANVTATLRLSY